MRTRLEVQYASGQIIPYDCERCLNEHPDDAIRLIGRITDQQVSPLCCPEHHEVKVTWGK